MKEHNVLFINACVRKESRTKRLADCLITKLSQRTADGNPAEGSRFAITDSEENFRFSVTEVRLEELHFPAADEAFLEKRDRLLAEEAFDDPLFSLARQFAAADEIVVAAPYWDLSFPAALKQYFEQINVTGITFRYNEQGIPEGLCRAGRIWYCTTAGGNYVPEDFGFGYVKALARGFYGIHDVRLVQAVGLDLYGADPEKIMKTAEEQLAEMKII
ncbi:MAG: NAD(P)H-dependent oxidoreductase [Lachnospiraceae bacterium]|nr:NAD(P)H-dependent oxidoreductase [Lachnospiraceae bacterium]